MNLISRIEVDRFRSIKEQRIDALGGFTAFAGLNNSGKSNILRALNAFFKNRTDANSNVDFSQDFYRHDLRAKKAKRFSVSVTFSLPESFKFRKGLEAVESLLGRSFTLKKLWVRDNPLPYYFLNELDTQLDLEKRALVEQFLALVSFRYIPNRVLPLDIIRNEHQSLRDVLIRRLAKRARGQEALFAAIGQTSKALIKRLQSAVSDACPEVAAIRLATPLSWEDLVFAFGYKLQVSGAELDDSVQGSGIQSLLMFETLSLIDRDYFQKFGWRQAAIWAVEEPESSLHTSLEARVASYLGRIASDPESRLQVLCTTHSDLMLQSADQHYHVSMSDGSSTFASLNKKTALETAARKGISRWTHPLLRYPLEPILLVEGKSDFAFVNQALKLIAPQKTIRVTHLEILQGGEVRGGVDEMKKYIKANVDVIRARITTAPVIVLLDWDSGNKKSDFEGLLNDAAPYRVSVWPESAFNPRLGKSFHGIERHLPDRVIDAADRALRVVGQRTDGTRTIASEDLGRFKQEVARVVDIGITESDLVHARAFLSSLASSLS